MIRLYFIFTIAISSLTSYSQDYKARIKEQFLRYSALLVAKEFRASTEYLNPAFFTLVSKDQLVQVMEMTFNNPSIEFEFAQPEVEAIQDKQKINGVDYAKFGYTNVMKMRVKSQEGKTLDTSATRKRLETQFGQGNVSYDNKSGFYQVVVHKNVVANSSNNADWKFVVIEERQKAMLERILPKEVLQ